MRRLANCRHHFWPYVEGVSEPTYTRDELEQMKAENHKFTYQGRTYDAYQATQKQRSIERTARKYIRRQTAFRAQGNEAEQKAAESKLRQIRAEYRAFSKAAGLPVQLNRMYVPENTALLK